MTVELLRRADVLALLGADDRHPRKQLGQNFVVDPGTIRRIVRTAGVQAGDRVVEVGPGLGSLTLGLLEAGAEVTCVEKDPSVAPLLGEVVAERGGGRVPRVVVGDALEVDLGALTGGTGLWKLVANLPYNVATHLVLRFLEEAPNVTSMLVMVQREVGERWVAPPGSRTYGVPSVLIALDADARLAGAIPREVFYPRPRVDSVLVALARRAGGSPGCDRTALRDLVRRGFGQRRKTLRRSLGLPESTFAVAGVDPGDRPEQLGVDAWCRLAAASSPDGRGGAA